MDFTNFLASLGLAPRTSLGRWPHFPYAGTEEDDCEPELLSVDSNVTTRRSLSLRSSAGPGSSFFPMERRYR